AVTDTDVGASGAGRVPSFDAPASGQAASLLWAGGSAVYTATYTVTQADVDAGEIANQATVSVTPPTGVPAVPPTDSGTPGDPGDPGTPGNPGDPTMVDAVDPAPDFTFVKEAALTTDNGTADRADLGDEITYTFTVTNTGNVTLTGVAVTDTDFSGSG